MVNNSTNINQMNNYISLQLTEHKKKTTTYITVEIQVQAWDRHKSLAVLNQLKESELSPRDNWISNDNTYINDKTKPAHSPLH